MSHRELETDVCIVGGGTGGVAAAIALCRAGVRCVMSEPTDWIGGQLTSQAVPPDENRWIEYEMGVPAATGSYLHYRDDVRQYYRSHRPLTPEAHANPRLNPGNGWVSHLCHEPTIAHHILSQLLAPHLLKGTLTLLLETEPTAADRTGDAVGAVTFQCSKTGAETTVRAKYFLDATEMGDLLELASVDYHVGSESSARYGEMHGHPGEGDVRDIQAISYCFAIEHRPGENHTIDRPANYGFWRDYVPPLSAPWPGKLLSWTVVGGENHEARTFAFRPWPQEPEGNELEMWRYRRIVDRSIYRKDASDAPPDVALINMVQMDYWLSPLIGPPGVISRQQRDRAVQESREQSLSFLYWMQTEAPRFDGTDGLGYPGLKLRGDELGTTDGFAKAPYIREARRLDAMFMVTEVHVGLEQRRADGRPGMNASPLGMAECFADSVGIGHYRLDLHPSCAHRNSVYAQSCPFRIPLGSLIAKRVTNVIAAGKCLGVTHVTNGAYRLHPVEWNIGESAGELAAFCLSHQVVPQDVRNRITLLREFQSQLSRHEITLAWPWEKGENL